MPTCIHVHTIKINLIVPSYVVIIISTTNWRDVTLGMHVNSGVQ